MTESQQNEAFESRLIPILREAVVVVKMIVFKELRDHLEREHPGRAAEAGRLAAAVLNRLFGADNPDPAFAAFVEAHRTEIDWQLEEFAVNFEKLRIPVTDALRIQFLCDSQEGNDSTEVLARAQSFGILLDDRDLPLPHSFLNLVRRLGTAHGIIEPPVPAAGENRSGSPR